jgi:hypothetical protein
VRSKVLWGRQPTGRTASRQCGAKKFTAYCRSLLAGDILLAAGDFTPIRLQAGSYTRISTAKSAQGSPLLYTNIA